MSSPSSASHLYGLPEGQEARFLAGRAVESAAKDHVLVHVVVEEARAHTLADQIRFFAPDAEVVILPGWDCLPYDRVSPQHDLIGHRIEALANLLRWQQETVRKPRVLLTTLQAVTQRFIPHDTFVGLSFTVTAKGRVNLKQFQSFVVSNGYRRTETVREPGEYAIRGGIIDIFPASHDNPIRIDLFGEDVESLKYFNAEDQLTLGKLEALSLLPATEYQLSESSIARFRGMYRELFGMPSASDTLYEAVSAARPAPGIEHWLPLFYEHMDLLDAYLKNPLWSMDAQIAPAFAERLEQIRDFYKARKDMEEAFKNAKGKDKTSLSGARYNPLPPEMLYLSEQEWEAIYNRATILHASQSPHEDSGDDCGARRSRDFSDVRVQPGADLFAALAAYVSELRSVKERKILMASYSEGARARLKAMLESGGFANVVEVASYAEFKKLLPQQLGLVLLPLERGFVADDLAIITEQDLLGDRLVRKTKRRGKAENFLREVSSLQAGDLVVHNDHGIGRFEGLETLKAGGLLHDCLKLVYDGGDKLFVPVENLEVLSRFGSDEGTTQLDKLGGAGWQARKARVKKDLMRMADQLLALAAARLTREGEKLEIPETSYTEFVARFPYHETDDQLRAIDEVLDDLVSGRPMDRLVCGDVGFGKTEVALRAAYVAAMAGVQVALLAPTTLLARQHAKTFEARFAGSGVRIGQLSRLVSAAEQKRTKELIQSGDIHVVIGTHALLASGVKFNHLGLMIVDEEQKFGVKQKEKLKELKSDVHVLTLSATPIPRTLQMSLSGVRDLSLITTPPVDRLAVRTSVLPYDPLVVREAILREHYRGGQSFYVVPRISDLADVEKMLDELVPDVKRITAHGQLTPTELEDRMSAFYDGQYGILLATNIIESGIDIPSANTLIVHRADMFGLAQLYQIRGRVGRSKTRAYAYITYPSDKKLSKTAERRLEVLETLDTLGAGFQLASHDMDIRGAGNLLGEEQSGHIREVGVELYQKMLEEAVASAKAGVDLAAGKDVAPDEWIPQINLGTSVLISEDYVSDLSVRMSLYRRLSDMVSEQDVEAFAAELIDRFGPLPSEVENLLDIVKIKQLCRIAGVDRVDAGPKGAVIGFYKDVPPKADALIAWLGQKRGLVKLRPDQKLMVNGIMDQTSQRVRQVRSALKELAALAG